METTTRAQQLWDELAADAPHLLHPSLLRLDDETRVAVVLVHLEQRTKGEAADALRTSTARIEVLLAAAEDERAVPELPEPHCSWWSRVRSAHLRTTEKEVERVRMHVASCPSCYRGARAYSKVRRWWRLRLGPGLVATGGGVMTQIPAFAAPAGLLGGLSAGVAAAGVAAALALGTSVPASTPVDVLRPPVAPATSTAEASHGTGPTAQQDASSVDRTGHEVQRVPDSTDGGAQPGDAPAATPGDAATAVTPGVPPADPLDDLPPDAGELPADAADPATLDLVEETTEVPDPGEVLPEADAPAPLDDTHEVDQMLELLPPVDAPDVGTPDVTVEGPGGDG